MVGSRTGAPPVGSSESGPTGHVSSPRLVKRSMRISRTTLSCLLRVKGYVAVRVGSAFRAAHSSRVLLHLFQPCPQCFRWVQPSPSRISSVSGPAVHRRLYHLASASLVAKVITDSGAASLHRRYPASLVLPTPPPPSRLSADFPVLPVIRPTFAPPISRRGEEGFSSCLARPRHRASLPPRQSVTALQPVCATPCRLRPTETDSASGSNVFSRLPVRSLSLRPGNSPTTLYGGRVNGLQVIGLPPPCHPSYGALALTPAGLFPR